MIFCGEKQKILSMKKWENEEKIGAGHRQEKSDCLEWYHAGHSACVEEKRNGDAHGANAEQSERLFSEKQELCV